MWSVGPDGGVPERGVKTRERDTCEMTGRERRKRGAGRQRETERERACKTGVDEDLPNMYDTYGTCSTMAFDSQSHAMRRWRAVQTGNVLPYTFTLSDLAACTVFDRCRM